MKYLVSLALVLTLAACSGPMPDLRGVFKRDRGAETSPPSQTTPPDSDVEVTELTPPEDTGDIEVASIDPDPADGATPSDGRVGTTVAALGDPAEPGFWIKTPLVTEATRGRVIYLASGRSVAVDILPLQGPAGGGSQISLAAMRLLEAPLTGLPELEVYVNAS